MCLTKPLFDLVLKKGQYGFIKTSLEICKIKNMGGTIVVEREPKGDVLWKKK